MRTELAEVGAPAMSAAPIATVLVSAAVAPVHAEPKASSEQVSQAVAGQVAMLLEVRDGWRRVRLGDGYEGWMHEGYLDSRALSAGELSEWRANARYSLGCTVLDVATSLDRSLPLGARIAHDLTIVAGEALDEQELRRRYASVGTEICASASRLFRSTSYQWGGITPWGADCSGMVQSVFGLHGAALPRDARQQAELGMALELTPSAWRAGDLLFFSDRTDDRITHVAIAAPEHTLMHVAIGRGGFAIENLNETTDAYTTALMGRLRSARRIL